MFLLYSQGADSVFAEDVILSDNEIIGSPPGGGVGGVGLSKSGHFEKRGRLDTSPMTNRSVSAICDHSPQAQVR